MSRTSASSPPLNRSGKCFREGGAFLDQDVSLGIDQDKRDVLPLNERRAAFDPITVIEEERRAGAPAGSDVDVAADRAVQAAGAGFAGDPLLVALDIGDGGLHAALEVGDQR